MVPNAGTILGGFRPSDPDQIVRQLNALLQRSRGESVEAGALPADAGASQVQAQTSVDPEVIQASRLAYLGYLAFLSAPFAYIAWLEIRDGRLQLFVPATLGLILVPFMLRFLWLALNPPELALDSTGITIPGGFARDAKMIEWGDLQDFVAYRPPGRASDQRLLRIAYFLVPSAQRPFSVVDPSTWSVQHVIPTFITLKADDLAARLNAYRQHAMGLTS